MHSDLFFLSFLFFFLFFFRSVNSVSWLFYYSSISYYLVSLGIRCLSVGLSIRYVIHLESLPLRSPVLLIPIQFAVRWFVSSFHKSQGSSPGLSNYLSSSTPNCACHACRLIVTIVMGGTYPSTQVPSSPSYRPNILLTPSRTFSSYSPLLSRHILAASTLAGLSSLGSASILMTEIRIFSTDWIGDHRSDACS